VQRPSANQAAWIILKPVAELSDHERALRKAIEEHCPALKTATGLARRLWDVIRQQRSGELDSWIEEALQIEIPHELRRFARGLKADHSAVLAALTLPWSNGQTEGHVNRLKLIKRQMFGRAKFDLLRQRVLESVA
jgi:transposase